jgi:hypothetical protein
LGVRAFRIVTSVVVSVSPPFARDGTSAINTDRIVLMYSY